MRFVDTNVFLYATIKPKSELRGRVKDAKKKSVEIVKRISAGEKVLTSVVHISEVSNVLESSVSNKFAQEIIEKIIFDENVEITSVDKQIYESALELAKMHGININDCVALTVMKENDIEEIYSFDTDFDNIEGIKRIEK